MPRSEQHLPKKIFTPGELETVLAVPGLGTPTGLPDRAILETLYSTGIRRTELTKLDPADIDHGRGVVMEHRPPEESARGETRRANNCMETRRPTTGRTPS